MRYAFGPGIGDTNIAASTERQAEADEDALYVCTSCESGWLYRAVRHTGRCPVCGEGLRSIDDGPRDVA